MDSDLDTERFPGDGPAVDPGALIGADTALAAIPDLVRVAEESERVVSGRLRQAGACTMRDLLILDTLHRTDGKGMRTKRLANTLGVSTSRLAYQLKGLESAGLISRTPHLEDRRGVVVRITERGSEARTQGVAALVAIAGDDLSGLADALPVESIIRAHEVLAGGEPGGSASRVSAAEAACFGQWCLEATQSAESFDRMFEMVAERLTGLLDLDLVRVFLRVGDVLSCVALRQTGATPIAGSGSSISAGVRVPSVIVCDTGEPFFSETRDDLQAGYPELVRFYDATGVTVGQRFSVPIRRGDEVVGSLSGGSARPGSWDDATKLVVETAARAMAVRLEFVDGFEFGEGNPELVRTSREDGLERSLVDAIAWGLTPAEAAEFLQLQDHQADYLLAKAMAGRGLGARDQLVELLRREQAESRLAATPDGALRR